MQMHLQRLGPHQFAHLRAAAEGLDITEAAKRFLGIEHATEAAGAHRLVVEQVRALARRHGDTRWRLVGIEIRDRSEHEAAPSITEWAEIEGLDGWSEEELQHLYSERFGIQEKGGLRRQARNGRLRQQRLALLRDLESKAGIAASKSDLLSGWLSPELSAAWERVGTLTLGDLQARISRGGRWYSAIKGMGPTKASRLANFLQLLIGEQSSIDHGRPLAITKESLLQLSGSNGTNRAVSPLSGIAAGDDREAIRTWIAARAGSALTAQLYERDAERFLLWCVTERGKALSSVNAEDCRAYIDFIADIPNHWISRTKAARFTPGWAPFKGQLKLATQKTALAMIHSLFDWLVRAGYLATNPWVLVNRKLSDDASGQADSLTSRAFTPEAWTALLNHGSQVGADLAGARNKFLLVFVEATGLRAAELLRGQRSHFTQAGNGWRLIVHGKGGRNREIPVPQVAMDAARSYFLLRGLDFDGCDGKTMLLASALNPVQGIGYQALQESFSRFVRAATRSLPHHIRRDAERGTAHWLRHTHGTRAVERGVPLDVLQANFGHKNPASTARYSKAQIERRAEIMERTFPAGTEKAPA